MEDILYRTYLFSSSNHITTQELTFKMHQYCLDDIEHGILRGRLQL